MELNGNPLVRTNAFDSIPKEMIEMIPHHLQTPNSSLKQFRAEYDWLVQQRQYLTELVIPGKVPLGECSTAIPGSRELISSFIVFQLTRRN